jgi:hypothetical protein
MKLGRSRYLGPSVIRTSTLDDAAKNGFGCSGTRSSRRRLPSLVFPSTLTTSAGPAVQYTYSPTFGTRPELGCQPGGSTEEIRRLSRGVRDVLGWSTGAISVSGAPRGAEAVAAHPRPCAGT